MCIDIKNTYLFIYFPREITIILLFCMIELKDH